ncbi:MAG TPA: primosomal protein N' [Planctomycetaceae bacterium]|nr:primosomal protein N' [Planctomycetaceae bacterium]
MTNEQRNLFDFDEPAPWDEDDQTERTVATVVFAEGPPGEFDYAVPDELVELVEIGRRVRCPLGRGNRPIIGYCVRLDTRRIAGRPLKPIADVIDRRTLLSRAMMRLTKWIAEHYLCPWAQVLQAVVPAGVRYQAGTRDMVILSVAPDAADRLATLDLPDKQAAALKTLAAANRPLTSAQLAKMAGCTVGPINELRKKGLVTARRDRMSTETAQAEVHARQQGLQLNDDQRPVLAAILAALNEGRHETLLVHGVTGSGKTEVYIQAIEEVIRFGRQAIVLVPEISLTPQTLSRFRSRFDRVAVLHSHLTDAERHGHWQRIAEGGVQVVVGARSAVFAPTPHLGLIVVDEEHESTFKQESAPRYHAREVAVARAKMESIPVVLGSATPSLESYHRARIGQYTLLEMPRRVLDRPMPAVGTIDLRLQIHGRHSRGMISRQLHAAMHEALADDGQIILLLNRRGFSTHIQCPACGHVVQCPHCEIALTHHRTKETALCHYCEYEIPAPRACPQCDFEGIRYSGQGTQRLEAEVRARFSDATYLRMDTDTMRSRGSHEKALDAFRRGDVRILLGTQMIAKGLDFPNVTLVGVINADTALHLPDFRAAERTFHLVTQVAGRTGRGDKGGRVLVQTFSPDHPAIRAAIRHDYAAFAASELPMRESLLYPPFAGMIRYVIRGPRRETTEAFAAEMAQRLRQSLESEQAEGRVLGPAVAPLARLRGMYRYQIHIHGPNRHRLRRAARAAAAELQPPDEVQWIADVDPLAML